MAKQLRQVVAVVRAAGTWLRRDLPEIVAPSSMPDPPGLAAEQAAKPRPPPFRVVRRRAWLLADSGRLHTWLACGGHPCNVMLA